MLRPLFPYFGKTPPSTRKTVFRLFSSLFPVFAPSGFHPFTAIIFLTSMLAFLEASRKQIVLVGGAYTAAVFRTYLLLGLGMLKAISAHHTIPIQKQLMQRGVGQIKASA